MRKLNLRWMLGLIVATIVCTGLAFFLHSFQIKRNASVYLREARRQKSIGEDSKAALTLKRYVQLAPDDVEGLVTYGLHLADIRSVQPAYFTLEQAIRKAPDRLDIRRRSVDMAMIMRRYSDAIDHLTEHLLKDSPDDSELLGLLATCQFGLADYDGAEATLQKAIKSSPEDVGTYFRLADLRQEKLDRTKEANDVIEEMVTRNPASVSAYLLRAEWRLRQLIGKQKKGGGLSSEQDLASFRSEIQADATKALEIDPESEDAQLLVSRIARRFGDNKAARAALQKGLEQHPDEPRFCAALAELETSTGNPRAAAEALRRGLAIAPDKADPDRQSNKDLRNPLKNGAATLPTKTEWKWSLANQLIEIGDEAEAVELIKQLRDAKHSEPLIGFLEARLNLRRKEWLAAITKLEKIRPRIETLPAFAKQVDLFLATAFRETNSPDQQLLSIRRALVWDPNWIPARLDLAEALAAQNHPKEAVTEFRQICATPGAPLVAFTGFAKSLLQWNLSLAPDQRNWNEFDGVLKKLEQVESQSTQIAMLKTERLLAEEHRSEAEKTLAAEKEKNPDKFEIWAGQIGLAQVDRDWERAERLIQDAEEKFGDSVAMRLLKGRLVSLRDPVEKALDQIRPLAEAPTAWEQPQRLQLAAEFAALYLTIGAFDESEKLAAFVDAAQPNTLRIQLLLLTIAQRSKNLKLMERVLDEIRKTTGDGGVWHYGQALVSLLSDAETKDDKNLETAISHLKMATATRPSWERIYAVWGEILERKGDTAGATEQYLEAIRLGEKSTIVTSRALALLLSNKRYDDADKLFQSLRESQSVLTDKMVQSEIELLIKLDRKDQALKAVNQLVGSSREKMDPLWLGHVFHRLDQFNRAAEQYRASLAVDPKPAEPWLALIDALVRSGEPDQAENVLNEMKSSIDRDRASLACGQAYEVLGKHDLARDHYRSAMQQFPDQMGIRRKLIESLLKTNGASEAETLLLDTLKDAPDSSNGENQQQRQWIIRSLVRALGLQRTREKLKDALELINNQLALSESKSPDDLRLKASILATFPNRESRQDAIAILEKLVLQDSPQATLLEDRWLLSQLYKMTSDREKSLGELRKMIFARKDDPRVLAAYIQLSLQAKDIVNAENYMKPLKKLAPDELSTVDLETQLLYERKKYGEIIKVLKAFEAGKPREQATPDSNLPYGRELFVAGRLTKFLVKLEQDKQETMAARFSSEAESILTKIVDENPKEIMLLVEFLGMTNQVDRSLDLLQKHGTETALGFVMKVARAIMRNPHASTTQLARLQELLKDIEANNQQSTPLKLTEADLLNWRGEFKTSADTFREVLRQDSKNIFALNNLAFLIALTGGDLADALQLVNQAINLGGPIDSLLDTRGMVHLKAGHSPEAIKDFDNSLRENENAERYFHKALAHARLLDGHKEATKALKQAQALGLVEHELHPAERILLSKLRAELNFP